MTTFDNREKAEENKYAHDKEVEFRIYAKYHGLLAAWIAKNLGLDAEGAEKYKHMLVTSYPGRGDADALFHKIKQEFKAHKVQMGDHHIREEMHHMMHAARKQVLGS